MKRSQEGREEAPCARIGDNYLINDAQILGVWN